MVDRLKGLFGGGSDDSSKPETPVAAESPAATAASAAGAASAAKDAAAALPASHQDFIQRVTTGDPTEGYSSEEAMQNFQTVMQHASPEQIQSAAKQALNNMSPGQRSDFAKMLQERQAGQGYVPIEQAGGGSATASQSGGGGGLDDILGSLFGQGGGGLGGLLGGLLGGGGGGVSQIPGFSQETQQPGTTTTSASPMGGLGELMKSPLGKALIAGIAAYGMKELMDKK